MTKKITIKKNELRCFLLLLSFTGISAFNRSYAKIDNLISYKNYEVFNISSKGMGGGDTIKPVIINADANTNNEIKIQVTSNFIDRTKVTDNNDMPALIITNGPGTSNGVNATFIGNYTLIYNATDGSGNKADTKTYKYIVDDYIAPVIILNTSDTILWPVNKAYTPVQASVEDNYYYTSQVSLTRTSNVNAFKLGLYYDEFTAIDGSGNVTVRRRYVRVVEAPAGITILDKNLGVNVYPNPSSGMVNITYKLTSPEEIEIEVYTIEGILVKRIKGIIGQNGAQAIDLDNEANGLYTFKIKTDTNVIARKVLIVH